MGTLKVKFKLNGLELELEGEQEVVISELSNFKEFVSTTLLNNPGLIKQLPTNIPEQINQIEGTSNIPAINEIPILKEVVRKDLPKTETDWILIYAFYVSNFGNENFTEADIRKQYKETGRDSRAHLKNFNRNINQLLNNGYIKCHNDTEYLLKQNGVSYCHQILEENASLKSTKTTKPRKALKNTELEKSLEKNVDKKPRSGKVEFIDLGFNSDKIKSLKDFFDSKRPKSQNEQVAVVMKWMADDNKKSDIDVKEISYLLKVCTKVPAALEQVLINMKGNLNWIINSDGGKVKLSSIGESHVLNDLPKA